MRARRGLVDRLGRGRRRATPPPWWPPPSPPHDADIRPGGRADDGAPRPTFVDAWERARTATFVRTGTFERRSDVTGSVDQLRGRAGPATAPAAPPPARRHRRPGRPPHADRARARPEGEPPEACTLGEPGGPTYDEDVAREVAALRDAASAGDDPVYAVGRGGDPGCFELVQRRVEPRAPFGREARFCFDAATGAPDEQPGGLRGRDRRGGRGHRRSGPRSPTRTRALTEGHGGTEATAWFQVLADPGSMQLEGVATPVPFP